MEERDIHELIQNTKDALLAKLQAFLGLYDSESFDSTYIEDMELSIRAEMQALEDCLTPTSEPDIPLNETQVAFLKEASK